MSICSKFTFDAQMRKCGSVFQYDDVARNIGLRYSRGGKLLPHTIYITNLAPLLYCDPSGGNEWSRTDGVHSKTENSLYVAHRARSLRAADLGLYSELFAAQPLCGNQLLSNRHQFSYNSSIFWCPEGDLNPTTVLFFKFPVNGRGQTRLTNLIHQIGPPCKAAL
jgi:hypothetical protein